ncbi:MAG: hypothetical protein AB7J35_11435 [Dehalococcoidia bacterium]
MRKYFIGLMLSSALGAVAIGSALAWTGSGSWSGGSASAGSVSIVLTDWSPSTNKVVPTGSPIEVGTVGFLNNGDVTVHATGGSVSTTGPYASCATGSATVSNGGNVSPGQQYGGLVAISLTMPTDASDDCQGQSITFDITVNVET